MPHKDRRIYRFDDFTLDVGEHCLKRGDEDLSLPPKTFAVLLYLVQRHGRLVKKNDLLDGVWADTVVTENALTWCIKEVRNAIDDDAQHPRYIQTVPRVGYKFIAPVEEVTATEVEEEEEEYTALSVRITEEGEERIEDRGSRIEQRSRRPPSFNQPPR
jgi:DNA-binding winged helix-turn-helix (wHTH) protein